MSGGVGDTTSPAVSLPVTITRGVALLGLNSYMVDICNIFVGPDGPRIVGPLGARWASTWAGSSWHSGRLSTMSFVYNYGSTT